MVSNLKLGLGLNLKRFWSWCGGLSCNLVPGLLFASSCCSQYSVTFRETVIWLFYGIDMLYIVAERWLSPCERT